MAALACCCLMFAGFTTWSLFVLDAEPWSDRIPVVEMLLAFAAGAVYCFAEYFRTHGAYDGEGIELYTPWTGRKVEKWSDLEAVSFSAAVNCYVFKFKTGGKIRLSRTIGGLAGVLRLLQGRGFELE